MSCVARARVTPGQWNFTKISQLHLLYIRHAKHFQVLLFDNSPEFSIWGDQPAYLVYPGHPPLSLTHTCTYTHTQGTWSQTLARTLAIWPTATFSFLCTSPHFSWVSPAGVQQSSRNGSAPCQLASPPFYNLGSF